MSKLKFNREKLNLVLQDFCALTDVSVAVTDESFKSIAECSKTPPRFCMEIQKSFEGASMCECSDISLLKRCRESRTAESHICHAGILDAAVPIIKSSKIIGYVLIGRMRVLDFDENRIIRFKSNVSNMKELYYDIAEHSEKQIQSMLRLATMIVSFILTNNIISVEADEFAAIADSFIETNINSELTVGRFCKELNVSKNVLYEKFRNSFGTTVNDYITTKRLEKGKELLLNTDMPISLIADKCGFGSYTYFSTLFKRENGVSPVLYRKYHKHS